MKDLLGFGLLALSTAAFVWAAESTPRPADCDFRMPDDATDCRPAGSAVNFLAILKKRIEDDYVRQRGAFIVEDVESYARIAHYAVKCGRKTCDDYDFFARFEVAPGWLRSRSVLLHTEDGSCRTNSKYLRADSHALIESARTERNVLQVKKFPGGRGATRPFYSFPRVSPDCADAGGNYRIGRRLVISDRGIYVSDSVSNPDEGVSARPASRLIKMKGNGVLAPELEFPSPDRVRLAWSNGAFIELDSSGQIVGSNFLDERTWKSGSCRSRVSGGGAHATPQVFLVGGQRFAR